MQPAEGEVEGSDYKPLEFLECQTEHAGNQSLGRTKQRENNGDAEYSSFHLLRNRETILVLARIDQRLSE